MCQEMCPVEVGNKKSNVKYHFMKTRVVTDQQRTALKAKLLSFLATYRNEHIKHVLYPNVLLEFGKFNVSQIKFQFMISATVWKFGELSMPEVF